MYQRDYILRMIEMMARLIAGILKLIKTGDLNQASQSLQNAYGTVFRNESPELKAIPEDTLIETLLNKYNHSTGHMEILAELFYAEAELLTAEKISAESISFYRKSLILFEYVDKEYRSYSQERQDKMLVIRKKLTMPGLKIGWSCETEDT
ncbi:MAG: hypothetical protein JW973_00470 [Bacteroidales bacterium]|nr:hypothetical protein [Bacteroidales bacterium]